MAGLQSVRGVDFPQAKAACKNGKQDFHKESTTASCRIFLVVLRRVATLKRVKTNQTTLWKPIRNSHFCDPRAGIAPATMTHVGETK
ncbi:hypothetical protein E2C01_042354 [Portunus trituberculatus]|uniref:Uncharacterized protein n=1 Tax=Portunus trituberculatus TaxID=210409 RepID=A0A5B7FT86_PORTR|nr:hypothetical protein [Portunus trituberculatus]